MPTTPTTMFGGAELNCFEITSERTSQHRLQRYVRRWGCQQAVIGSGRGVTGRRLRFRLAPDCGRL